MEMEKKRILEDSGERDSKEWMLVLFTVTVTGSSGQKQSCVIIIIRSRDEEELEKTSR